MSLRGRYFIDRIKSSISHRFKLPCPPYGNPLYWDGVYKKLGPTDEFEWGGMNVTDDLMIHTFDLTSYQRDAERVGYRNVLVSGRDENMAENEHSDDEGGGDGCHPGKGGDEEEGLTNTTFGEALGVHPYEKGKVLLLGCGNSRMGEEMVDLHWTGPILQVDVSAKVVSDMQERCASHVQSGTMDMVHDDATKLTAFGDGTVDAVCDKGLADALFCADDFRQLTSVMDSVHRVLRPGGKFVLLSFSRPQFILDRLVSSNPKRRKQMWGDLQIRALPSIIMYRFEKQERKKQHPPGYGGPPGGRGKKRVGGKGRRR